MWIVPAEMTFVTRYLISTYVTIVTGCENETVNVCHMKWNIYFMTIYHKDTFIYNNSTLKCSNITFKCDYCTFKCDNGTYNGQQYL